MYFYEICKHKDDNEIITLVGPLKDIHYLAPASDDTREQDKDADNYSYALVRDEKVVAAFKRSEILEIERKL